MSTYACPSRLGGKVTAALSAMSLVRGFVPVGLALAAVNASAQQVAIQRLTPLRAVFAESDTLLRYSISVSDETRLVARWSIATAGRVFARGESDLSQSDSQQADVSFTFRSPPVRDGLVSACEFRVAVGPAERPALARSIDPFWVYPRDPFASRRKLFENHKLVVYDPQGDTSELLDREKVPHSVVNSVRRFRDPAAGLVLIGEGVDFDDYPALAREIHKAAAEGVRFMCLAPRSGGFNIHGDGPSSPAVRLLSVDALAERHKMLDVSPGESFGRTPLRPLFIRSDLSSLQILANQKSTVSWPWIEVDYPAPKRARVGMIAVCGYQVINAWDSGPTARYLLAETLQTLMAVEQ